MILDGRQEPLPERADVVVVGSGAVGLPVAVDLARHGFDVLVLEAGGLAPSDSSQAYFKAAENVGTELKGLYTGRFRCLGGTTHFWGGQLARLDPCVFEERPWMAPLGWPISSKDLEPFYDAANGIVGMADAITPDREVWRRLRVEPPADTDHLSLFVTRWARTRNFPVLFGKEVKKSSNLIVACNSPVTCFYREAVGRRVGVCVRTEAGETRLVKAKQVILANGTIEIARLLQLPLADGQAAPWAENPWLGRGFFDHLECIAGRVRPIDKTRFNNVFDNALISGVKYSPKIKLTCRAQASMQSPGMAANMVFNSSVAEHIQNAKIFFRALLRGRFERGDRGNLQLLSGMRFAMPMLARYIRSRRIYNLADLGIQLRLVFEQKPTRESRIRLTDKRDAIGIACAQVDWRIDGSEIDGLASFAELVRGYLRDNHLADVDIDPRLAARDPGFLSTAEDINHHMGGARMALRPTDGVVDKDLRVFGADNLYVAGAAVFPTSGFINPTLTAMALGLRLADTLRRARMSP